MRMLRADERDYLFRSRPCACREPRGVVSDKENAERRRIHYALKEAGRVELPRCDECGSWGRTVTAMGEKALRIDALIRQWGFGS